MRSAYRQLPSDELEFWSAYCLCIAQREGVSSAVMAEINSFYVEHQAGRDLRIHDPALGYAYNIDTGGTVSDAVMYDTLTSPIGQRSLDVGQLSKSAMEETIDGLEAYRRFQHIAGVFETSRHFAQKLRLDPETALIYTLVSTLSDLAHGVKSHAADIMIEGAGGSESFHETRLGQIIDHGGLAEIFEKHGIPRPNTNASTGLLDMFGVPIPSWVENEAGEPNVDRINYIAGESRLWFPGNELVEAATSLDSISVNEEGQFVFTDHDLARTWGKLGLLLSSEHWNDPINRLILLISVETIKRTIFQRYLKDIDEVDNGNQAVPEDYTFFCDADFDKALERQAFDKHHPDGFMTAAHFLLYTLGRTERLRFATHKRQVYESFLSDQKATEYPSPYINPHIAKFGPLPVAVELLSADDVARAEDAYGRGQIVTKDGRPIGLLKNLKPRQFDPLVKTATGETKPLSAVDANYQSLLRQHSQAINYTQAMQLLMNRQATQTFCEAIDANNQAMRRSAEHNPLSRDQLRRVIKGAGERAMSLAVSRGMWREI